MLNWIALFFEVIGFSLTTLVIYFPNAADSFEDWLDDKGSIHKIKRPIIDLTECIDFIFPSIFTAILVVAAMEYFSSKTFHWISLLVIGVAVIIIIYAFTFLAVLLRYMRNFIPFVFSIIVRLPIYISNKIHPSNHALGGAGLVLAFIGLCLDFYQAVFDTVV